MAEARSRTHDAEAGVPARILRNTRRVRRLHAAVYLVTAFLLYSGISVAGEARPVLATLIGGQAAAARWHRWVGFGLIALGLLLPLVRPRSAVRFLMESVRFRRSDVRWFRSYPAFLLAPRRHPPARHEGRYDPGQRVLNCVIVVAFTTLAVSGLVMSVPDRVTSATFAASFKIHVIATLALVVSLAGHVLVGSGLLSAYRGVWRAMHGDGRVRTDLSERLWPAWTEREGRDPAAGRGSTPSQHREL